MKTNVGLPTGARRLLAHFWLHPHGDGQKEGRLILAEVDDDEYVVSLHYRHEGRDWDENWAQGHYFSDLDKARVYFVHRCLSDTGLMDENVDPGHRA